MCSLCHNGISGGALYLDEGSITFKSSKLTIDKAYKNLVLALDEVAELTWKWIIFPIATFRMKSGEEYTFLIFNKWRFKKWFQAYRTNKG